MDQLQTYEDFITNYVDVANEDILLDLNNDYASNHMYEEYIKIFDNDEDFFDMYFQNQEEIERAKEYGEYYWKDKYVTLDEENNIYSYESLSEALEEKFNRQAVIDYMVESKYLRDEYIDYLNEEISCFNKKELMETFYTNQNPDILNVVSEDLMYMIKYDNESDNQFTFKELEDLFNKTELRAKTLKKAGRESDQNFNLQYEIKEEVRYKIEELNYIEAKELINNLKNPHLKRIIAKEKYNLENFYEIYDTVEEKNNEYIFENLGEEKIISEERLEEIRKGLEECVREVFSHIHSGINESLVYDPEEDRFTTSMDTGGYYPNLVYLATMQTKEFEWQTFLCQSYSDELKAMLNIPHDAEFDYPQEIIDTAKKIVEDEDIDINDKDEARYVLENCGASDFILQDALNANIEYYLEDRSFGEFFEEAVQAYEAYLKEREPEKLIPKIHIPITPEDEADAKKIFKNFTGQDIDLPENKPKQGKIYDPEVKRTIELNAHFLNLKQDYIVNKFLNREKEREVTLAKSETKEKPKLNLSKPREGRGRER
ncbi:hypothetical protein [Dialister micraerophilus]|uniref:hypothetical protein n=1 Tax=Dialister micraerophilus TaxID=309120 RepID=UPI0023F38FBE|nr:hypothetical protein [Dialister micraerophilus]